jgi:hypothetical protein
MVTLAGLEPATSPVPQLEQGRSVPLELQRHYNPHDCLWRCKGGSGRMIQERFASWRQQASVIGAVGKAAAFAVLRIAHLRQVAALQVVATTLEMALGRARLPYNRQQHQRCRQRDDKHSHDLAPLFSVAAAPLLMSDTRRPERLGHVYAMWRAVRDGLLSDLSRLELPR